MARLPFDQIAAKMKDAFGDAVVEVNEGNKVPFVLVEADAVARAAHFLRDEPELSFDYLMYVTAVDLPEEDKLTLVYHYFSYRNQQSLMVKADVPRRGGSVRSVAHLYAAAEWLEREVYDLFGVTFEGHPNLKRILTPEGFQGHPLLKDFANEDYVPFPDKMPAK
ncbi:MAG: NADH-quinone oxidoreductase subunit C [candidate division Zixibacteria bacterium]|nr:NADH-quinone oxidoreductase subunit C [candidate division Zixibacteria bacterium]